MSSSSVATDWLIFTAILLAIGIGIACFVLWFFMLRKTGKKKRKHRSRRHRHHNPTLAESGGLPPARQSNKPPRGV
jgi:heme/copper-type cytochrome/quinol oxidase subunit 2